MSDIALLETTGDQQIDALLRGIIGVLEAAFPDRIRGYYLFGSYADGSGMPTSDIDLFIVPKGRFTVDEEGRRERIGRSCALLSSRSIDLIAVGEEMLFREGLFRLEAGSRLIYGVDIRDRLPRQSLDQYLRRYVQAPWDYITQVLRARAFRESGYLVYPLQYPDPAAEFYGYDQPRLPHRQESAPNMKALVATACWIATVIVGLRAGRTVAAKSASVRLYQELIGDEWAGWLEALYEWGNRRWSYLIPEAPSERRLLRDLCARMLAFENVYLTLYRDYLLAQLRRGSADRSSAVKRLSEVLYPDDEVIAALQAVAGDDDDDPELRAVAACALRRVQGVCGTC